MVGTQWKSPRKIGSKAIGVRINIGGARLCHALERQYTQVVLNLGRTVNADDACQAHCRELAEALTADDRHFGVLLMGNVGSGKTTLMTALQKFFVAANWSVGIKNICNVDTDGLRIVRAKNIQRDGERWQYFDTLCREPLLGIDDLGAEPTEQLVFGNASTPVTDLLEERYDRRLFTIATTNLSCDMLEKKYGARITDRMNEMFKIIIFKNKSYRCNWF